MTMHLLLAAVLTFTLPSQSQNVYYAPPPTGTTDSLHVECDGGPPIHNLETVRLYFHSIQGGGWSWYDEHAASGREGMVDSFKVWDAGHYYVTTTNPGGESCASNMVYVPPDTTVTGVGDPSPTPTQDAVEVWFDVNGRRVVHPTRSGVYWAVTFRGDKKAHTRKVVILR